MVKINANNMRAYLLFNDKFMYVKHAYRFINSTLII